MDWSLVAGQARPATQGVFRFQAVQFKWGAPSVGITGLERIEQMTGLRVPHIDVGLVRLKDLTGLPSSVKGSDSIGRAIVVNQLGKSLLRIPPDFLP